MQRIKFEIPDARKFQFTDDLTAWEKASYKDSRLIAGDAVHPYKTTTVGSPLFSPARSMRPSLKHTQVGVPMSLLGEVQHEQGDGTSVQNLRHQQ
jgi:hypothetical protein